MDSNKLPNRPPDGGCALKVLEFYEGCDPNECGKNTANLLDLLRDSPRDSNHALRLKIFGGFIRDIKTCQKVVQGNVSVLIDPILKHHIPLWYTDGLAEKYGSVSLSEAQTRS